MLRSFTRVEPQTLSFVIFAGCFLISMALLAGSAGSLVSLPSRELNLSHDPRRHRRCSFLPVSAGASKHKLILAVFAVSSWLSAHTTPPVSGSQENPGPQHPHPGKPILEYLLLLSNHRWAHPDLGGRWGLSSPSSKPEIKQLNLLKRGTMNIVVPRPFCLRWDLTILGTHVVLGKTKRKKISRQNSCKFPPYVVAEIDDRRVLPSRRFSFAF